MLVGLPVLAADASPGNSQSTDTAYPDAVRVGREAAQAILSRAGAESCLRGKLNRALLGLSDSCGSLQQRTPLCELADRAVVVTPMNLAFMDETARGILELSE